jgi:predicted TIM-barrel fold metal-dependent hydrolase
MLDRRKFLAAGAAAAASRLRAQPGAGWGGSVLDIHMHFRRSPEANLAHIEGAGVTRAVLLTPVAAARDAVAVEERYSGRFVHFTSGNAVLSEAVDQLSRSAKSGARGFGEMKLKVALDGPEMRRIYAVAAELNIPVLLHFQDTSNPDDSYNTGFSRLPAILKAYPKTTFIGHANSFWSNISAEVPPDVAYPSGPVKAPGLTDKLLSDYPNLYGDLSANSGNNGLNRDPDFAREFLVRHQDKLMFGSDCPCADGHGTGQVSNEPRIKGRCVARETLATLQRLASPQIFRKITWENGTRLLKLPA